MGVVVASQGAHRAVHVVNIPSNMEVSMDADCSVILELYGATRTGVPARSLRRVRLVALPLLTKLHRQ